jgi:inosine-uridine nucleoside N-ribohydrolase
LPPESIPIVLDCDPGHDDAIALLLALASPELDVRAVTTVAGNQTLDKTTRNALRVLELAGRTDIPVAAGAERPLVRAQWTAAYVHGESGLDGPDLPEPRARPLERHAVDIIAELVDPSVTLVAIGPLTNVALLLAMHPYCRPARIVLMGGAIGEGNVTPAAEFNIWVDPEAAKRVFESGVPITMVGLDVTHKALATPRHADAMRASGRVGKAVAEMLDFYGRFHHDEYGWEGSPIHDAVALAYLARPNLLSVQACAVEIETQSELSRGRTLVDLWGRTGREANADVAVDIEADTFLALLVDRIASLG